MASIDGNKKDEKKRSGFLSSLGLGNREPAPVKRRFEITVDELRQKFDPVVVSRMQILNLNSLVVRRGGDRKAIIENAEFVAAAVIEENLRPGEGYVHNDVGIYGFLFPKMSASAAELRFRVIADQITRIIQSMDTTFSSVDFELKRLKRKSKSHDNDGGSGANRKTPDKAATQEEDNKKKLANLAFDQMARRNQPNMILPDDAPPTWWVEGQGAAQANANLPEELGAVFRPVWNVKSKLLTAYIVMPVLRAPSGSIETIVRVRPDSELYATVAALDRWVQNEALRKLKDITADGHKILLVVPVHFPTIDRHDLCVSYLQQMRNLGDNERKLIVHELVNTPKDVQGPRIRETVTRLRQVTRSVLARINLNDSRVTPWSKTGIHALGFDCLEDDASEKSLFAKFENFAERAETAGLKKFAHGLATRSAAGAAVAAGYDYIEGNIVRGPADSPTYVEPFESMDLFAGLFRR